MTRVAPGTSARALGLADRPPAELGWGRHFLMCPPDHFDVSYTINPWMDPGVKVDPDIAREQWAGLAGALRAAGATIEEVQPEPGLPDMVFVANAGIVDGSVWWPARMRHEERQAEVPHVTTWFRRHGWDVEQPPPTAPQEGMGDALPFAGRLVTGYGTRSAKGAYAAFAVRSGWEILPVELRDPRYYHLDLAFCPLSDTSAIVVPEAFTQASCEALQRLVPDPILTTPEEGPTFCANSVVVGRTIVMPACPPRLGRLLERRGLEVVQHDASEFLKAGGGCRCLTLPLDCSLPTYDGEERS